MIIHDYPRLRQAYIDADEVGKIITLITTSKEKLFPVSSDNYKEIYFKSRSNFALACFKEKDEWGLNLILMKKNLLTGRDLRRTK